MDADRIFLDGANHVLDRTGKKNGMTVYQEGESFYIWINMGFTDCDPDLAIVRECVNQIWSGGFEYQDRFFGFEHCLWRLSLRGYMHHDGMLHHLAIEITGRNHEDLVKDINLLWHVHNAIWLYCNPRLGQSA